LVASSERRVELPPPPPPVVVEVKAAAAEVGVVAVGAFAGGKGLWMRVGTVLLLPLLTPRVLPLPLSLVVVVLLSRREEPSR